MVSTLVMFRHGESVWNAKNLFTGWVDVDLSEKGEKEAQEAGKQLKEEGLSFDVLHTSVLTRAVRTANVALEVLGQSWLPVQRSWRLNERHYGALQGKDKLETVKAYGKEQVLLWRRSFDIPPPPITEGHPRDDRRYRLVSPDALPACECLKEVAARVLPWWQDSVVPQLRMGLNVLVVAHGNSLRALMKHLEYITDEDIMGLNVPTAMPRLYAFNEDMTFAHPPRYLDEATAQAGALAVQQQTG